CAHIVSKRNIPPESESVDYIVFSVISFWNIDCHSWRMASRKVLIVEDDAAMAQMCAKLVRRRGHLAVIAATCQDALSILRDAADIDVVLSDIQMPNMSGIELLLQLR